MADRNQDFQQLPKVTCLTLTCLALRLFLGVNLSMSDRSTYDVFLSHNSDDKDTVKALAHLLQEVNLDSLAATPIPPLGA